MWGGEEPIDINDAVVELPGNQGDDSMKAQKRRKWDKEKKRFVNVFVDPEGKVLKDKEKGAFGKPIQKLKDKYNKWVKRTHVRIQDAGEAEDERMVENARSSSKSRKDYIKEKHGPNRKAKMMERRPRRTELRNPEEILKAKKTDLRHKKARLGKPNPSQKFARANRKMAARSAPTRSKMIVRKR